MNSVTDVAHSWLNQSFHQEWLTQQSFNLLSFYKRSRCTEGGFFDLDRAVARFQNLDDQNCISNLIWNGKPNLYHAYLMTLKFSLPISPSLL